MHAQPACRNRAVNRRSTACRSRRVQGPPSARPGLEPGPAAPPGSACCTRRTPATAARTAAGGPSAGSGGGGGGRLTNMNSSGKSAPFSGFRDVTEGLNLRYSMVGVDRRENPMDAGAGCALAQPPEPKIHRETVPCPTLPVSPQFSALAVGIAGALAGGPCTSGFQLRGTASEPLPWPGGHHGRQQRCLGGQQQPRRHGLHRPEHGPGRCHRHRPDRRLQRQCLPPTSPPARLPPSAGCIPVSGGGGGDPGARDRGAGDRRGVPDAWRVRSSPSAPASARRSASRPNTTATSGRPLQRGHLGREDRRPDPVQRRSSWIRAFRWASASSAEGRRHPVEHGHYGLIAASAGIPGSIPGTADGQAGQVSGDSHGFGWVAGFEWRPTDRFAVGYSHRSEIDQDIGATPPSTRPASFAGAAAAVPADGRAVPDGAADQPCYAAADPARARQRLRADQRHRRADRRASIPSACATTSPIVPPDGRRAAHRLAFAAFDRHPFRQPPTGRRRAKRSTGRTAQLVSLGAEWDINPAWTLRAASRRTRPRPTTTRTRACRTTIAPVLDRRGHSMRPMRSASTPPASASASRPENRCVHLARHGVDRQVQQPRRPVSASRRSTGSDQDVLIHRVIVTKSPFGGGFVGGLPLREDAETCPECFYRGAESWA